MCLNIRSYICVHIRKYTYIYTFADLCWWKCKYSRTTSPKTTSSTFIFIFHFHFSFSFFLLSSSWCPQHPLFFPPLNIFKFIPLAQRHRKNTSSILFQFTFFPCPFSKFPLHFQWCSSHTLCEWKHAFRKVWEETHHTWCWEELLIKCERKKISQCVRGNGFSVYCLGFSA